MQQSVLRVVEELTLLALLDLLNGQAQLLADLIVRRAEEVRDACLHFEHSGHGVQGVLARIWLIVNEGLRQLLFTMRAALNVGPAGLSAGFNHAVHPVDAGLNRIPRQEVDEPTRSDA